MKNISTTQEKGSILAISLMIITCVGILIAGLAPLSYSQVRHTGFLQNRIAARYAAEAGAKVVIKQVETYIDNMAANGQTLENCTTNGNAVTNYIDADQKLAFNYKYWPLTSPNRVRIQVSSVSGTLKKSVDVLADVYVDSQTIPNALVKVDLASSIVNANKDPMKNLYCGWSGYNSSYNGTTNGTKANSKALWTTKSEPLIDPQTGQVMKNPQTGEDLTLSYASPPNNVAGENGGNNESRILFDERFKDGEVDFSYRFAFQKTEASGGGGPGVFYGVQDADTNSDGTPDKMSSAKNFTSYTVAFNRNSGSFAVNKQIANGTQYTNVYNDGEPKLTKFLHKSAKLYNSKTKTYDTVSNYCPDFQSYIGTNSQFKNHGYAFQPNGTGLSTQGVTADGLKYGTKDAKGNVIKTAKQYADEYAASFDISKDKQAVDPLGNQIGRCAMSWEMLEAILRNYYKKLKAEGKTVLEDGITKIPDDPDNFSLSSENNGITINVKTTKETMAVQQGDLEMDCYTGEVKWTKTGVLANQEVMRQQIFIDGCEVLNFVDLNKYYNVAKLSTATSYESGTVFFDYDNSRAQVNLKNSRSGFRIQNVTNTSAKPMKFYSLYSNATATTTASGRVLWIQ